MAEDFPLKDECYKVIGCCMEVHKELGAGFLEAVYQEALGFELGDNEVPFEKEKELDVYYKGRMLDKKYVADFICYDELILELKALQSLTPDHSSQVINYLKATGFHVGLLINFGSPTLQYKRVVY